MVIFLPQSFVQYLDTCQLDYYQTTHVLCEIEYNHKKHEVQFSVFCLECYQKAVDTGGQYEVYEYTYTVEEWIGFMEYLELYTSQDTN